MRRQRVGWGWLAMAIGALVIGYAGEASAAGCGGGAGGGGTSIGGGGGCGGGGVAIVPAKPLPPLVWETLDSGLAKAEKASKPLVVVFTTKEFKGPGTFENWALRDALKASGAIIARVLPPEAPSAPAGAKPEEVQALQDAYVQALKTHAELAKKYGVTMQPTQVFLTSGGEQMATLATPSQPEVQRYLQGLPKLVEQYKAAKARIEEAKAPAPAGAPASKG